MFATFSSQLGPKVYGVCKYYIGPIGHVCHNRRAAAHIPARNWPSMYSFFAQKWYGLLSFWARSWLRARNGCFSELLLADIRRLSVVPSVVALYQITVFYNKTQQHHFWNFILMTQCKLCTHAAAAVAVDKDRSPMGRCSIYRHPKV